MSRFLKHTLRCVVFLAVLALLLTGVSQLVRPKNNTRSDGIHDPAANGILGEPDNTIDLLILGDSESYSAFIPMQLWQQYGYTAYCCGTSRQTLYYSEAFLHKAFQKQSPKLVILETDVIFIDFSYGSMLLQGRRPLPCVFLPRPVENAEIQRLEPERKLHLYRQCKRVSAALQRHSGGRQQLYDAIGCLRSHPEAKPRLC